MPLRVLMFGWEFPPHNSGGLGTACFGLTRALAREGAEIIFVLPKRLPVTAEFLKLAFADLPEVYAVNSLLYPYVTADDYARLSAALGGSLYGHQLLAEVSLYALRAGPIAETNDFDCIHAHDWLTFPAGLAAKRVSGKPLVVHVHATEFDRTGGQGVNPAVYAIEKRGLEQADRIIAVSHFTKNTIVSRYQIKPEKIAVVHNGIDEADVGPAPSRLNQLKAAGRKIVLFVGRVTLQKGPDYFIRVAKRVLELYPDVYFIIAGSGDMERQVINETAWLGIADRVMFTGFLRGEDLAGVYRAADLYVLPSVSEPFGITPLEALAHGTPVLVSKQSGVAEVLRHALKTDFWDIDEMANKIVAVLKHDGLRQTLADNGRREIGKLSWCAAAKKCLELYRQLSLVPRPVV